MHRKCDTFHTHLSIKYLYSTQLHDKKNTRKPLRIRTLFKRDETSNRYPSRHEEKLFFKASALRHGKKLFRCG